MYTNNISKLNYFFNYFLQWNIYPSMAQIFLSAFRKHLIIEMPSYPIKIRDNYLSKKYGIMNFILRRNKMLFCRKFVGP